MLPVGHRPFAFRMFKGGQRKKSKPDGEVERKEVTEDIAVVIYWLG